MPLRPPGFPPITQADWDRYARNTPVIPDDNSVTIVKIADQAVTNSKLRDSAPASVIGRLSATPGMPADIVASADNSFLVRRAGDLTFGLLGEGDIPAMIARDTEVTTAISDAIATLQSQADPFTQYILKSTVLNGSLTYDPPSLVSGAQQSVAITVTGAAIGDFVLGSFSLDLQGIILSAYVSVANTVVVLMLNMTGGTLDLASGTLRARVWKQ